MKAAGTGHIKLHAARHTCATLMQLCGVPVAVVAAWIRQGRQPHDEALHRFAGRSAQGRQGDFGSSCDIS